MNFALKPIALSMLVATTQLAGVAYAQAQKTAAAVNEDSAQMKADEHALAREKMQLKTDQKVQKADTGEGKMAAESKDAEKVYKDSQNIKGEKKDIAADKANLKADQKK